jgi:hypothetical protein
MLTRSSRAQVVGDKFVAEVRGAENLGFSVFGMSAKDCAKTEDQTM